MHKKLKLDKRRGSDNWYARLTLDNGQRIVKSTKTDDLEQAIERAWEPSYDTQARIKNQQPTSLPAAFNLANSLFSMHEWMWNTYGGKLGGNLHSASDFNSYVQNACPAFKYMRDLANASKHVSLSSPSTQATHITNTAAIESKWGEGVWGVSKYGRGVVVIDDGGTKVDFENTADEVFSYWREMLSRLED